MTPPMSEKIVVIVGKVDSAWAEPGLYRCRPCRAYRETKTSEYGNAIRFACNELRRVRSHPDYDFPQAWGIVEKNAF